MPTGYEGALTTVSADTANMLLIDAIVAQMVTEGWTILESSFATGTDREYIMHSTGVSGATNIYVGLRSYQNVGLDYYNISLVFFTGYINGNTFILQPGYYEKGICAHNIDLYYWTLISKDYINIGLNIASNASFESGTVGFYDTYASPGQYPYPIMVYGTLNGQQAVRYSTTHYSGLRGKTDSTSRETGGIRTLDGTINSTLYIWPYFSESFGNTTRGNAGPAINTYLVDLEDTYQLLPLVLIEDKINAYGEIRGFYYVSGFNNIAGNTMTIDGTNYIILRDTNRTSFDTYIAMRIS